MSAKIKEALAALGPCCTRISSWRFQNRLTFPLATRASFSRCFAFVSAVFSDRPPVPAAFSAPVLRGICEDVIVLGFLRTIPPIDRDSLIEKLLLHELRDRIAVQATFFHLHRPSQSVLSHSASAELDAHAADVRELWKRNGWNLSKGTMPQTRQLAERLGDDALTSLYDYLYRLSSGTVHFSPQSLFRTGWGSFSDRRFVFSISHFDQYYLDLCQIYGVYLLCTYFEFFGRVLRPTRAESREVDVLRNELLASPRWPEMVTFEEMNLPPPKQGVRHLLARVAETRIRGKRLHKVSQKRPSTRNTSP